MIPVCGISYKQEIQAHKEKVFQRERALEFEIFESLVQSPFLHIMIFNLCSTYSFLKLTGALRNRNEFLAIFENSLMRNKSGPFLRNLRIL